MLFGGLGFRGLRGLGFRGLGFIGLWSSGVGVWTLRVTTAMDIIDGF